MFENRRQKLLASEEFETAWVGLTQLVELPPSYLMRHELPDDYLIWPKDKGHGDDLVFSPTMEFGKSVVQCIQAKISKTLDKRSTLIFAANCTEQKLSSSESYYLTPNL